MKNAPKVTCLNCKDQVPLTSWEDHCKSCCGGSSKQADSEYEVCDGGIRFKKVAVIALTKILLPQYLNFQNLSLKLKVVKFHLVSRKLPQTVNLFPLSLPRYYSRHSCLVTCF